MRRETYLVEFGEVLKWVLAFQVINEVCFVVKVVTLVGIVVVATSVFLLFLDQFLERCDLLGGVFASFSASFDARDVLKGEFRVKELGINVVGSLVTKTDHENFS